MKKIILWAALIGFLFCYLFCLVGCKATYVTKVVQSYVVRHCDTVSISNPLTGTTEIYFECDSLYSAPKLQSTCPDSRFCFDFSHGKLSGYIKCYTDSIKRYNPIKFSK